jgi:FkbM family methyltransferase
MLKIIKNELESLKKKISCYHQHRRYKRRLVRLAKCGEFQIKEIEGVKVAQREGLNLGHIFDGDGMLIVEEIFKNEEYNFEIGAEAVVIDIGMNIGLASLYFASRNDVKDVYGFEPFKPTFEQAIFNFKINEKYGGKIHPHNYGLGDKDKDLTFEYCTKAPGRMSTVKSITEIYHPDRKYATKTESVQIKNAAKEINYIIERHKDKKIVIKCDTEGSEKEIFEKLDSEGVLKNIDMIILEYHFSYDVPLLEILKRNGFVFFKQKTVSTETGDSGIIRAVKK